MIRESIYEILKYGFLLFLGGIFFFFIGFTFKSTSVYIQATSFLVPCIIYWRWSRLWLLDVVRIKSFNVFGKYIIQGIISGVVFVLMVFFLNTPHWIKVVGNVLCDFIANGLLFYFVILSFFEEVFFRGKLYDVFKKKGELLAILTTAIIFTIFHFGDPRVMEYIGVRYLYMLFIGLYLGVLRFYTKSIYPGFICHFMINAFIVTLGMSSINGE